MPPGYEYYAQDQGPAEKLEAVEEMKKMMKRKTLMCLVIITKLERMMIDD